MSAKKAVILFSGGLDSTTCLAIAQSQGFSCYALSIYYGQKHNIEVQSAERLAQEFNVVEHKIISIPMDDFGGSALTDHQIAVPNYVGGDGIPITYVPARNTIFLSLALSYAEVIGAYDIFFGANFVDYSQYPDCRPDYLETFERLASLATKVGREGKAFKIQAPLLYLSKADIVRKGIELGIDYSKTISCYRADSLGRACGSCDSCTYRKKGFVDANLTDPTLYVA